MIPFVAYTAAETPNVFQWASQSREIAISVGRSRPHLIYGHLGPRESAPKPPLDWFSHFAGRANVTNRQTMLLHLQQKAASSYCSREA